MSDTRDELLLEFEAIFYAKLLELRAMPLEQLEATDVQIIIQSFENLFE